MTREALIIACAASMTLVAGAPACRPSQAGGAIATDAARGGAPRAMRVPCTLKGTQRLYPGTSIFGSALRGRVIGWSRGDLVGFELSDLDVARGALSRVLVRAPPRGPAFVLDGYMSVEELDVHATRDVPIVPGHVSLASGATVHLLGAGTNGGARIVSAYGDFHEVAADAPCDVLTLDAPVVGVVPRPPRNASNERLSHGRRASALLLDADGKVLLRLGKEGEGATFELTESRGSLVHVLYDDGVRIDAWMRATDLLPGAGPDCDDCHGSIRDVDDRCPDYPVDDADGCPETTTLTRAVATRETEIRGAAAKDGAVLGRLERGAEVWVIDPRRVGAKGEASWPPGALVRVRPRHGEREPRSGSGEFFAEASALTPE